MEHTTNLITLRGELDRLPEFSHENHGRCFYRFTLNVPRLSGAVDSLPIVADELLLRNLDPCAGDMLGITDGIRRLLIFVFANSIAVEDGEPVNDVLLQGPLCREPTYRRTPLGREICDVMLAVPRGFRRADYLPCILGGRTAQQIATCHTRDRIQVCGRLQSRTYTKLTDDGLQERTAYEISALNAQVLECEY